MCVYFTRPPGFLLFPSHDNKQQHGLTPSGGAMILVTSHWPERLDAELSLAHHMWARPPRYDIIQHTIQLRISGQRINKNLNLQLKENQILLSYARAAMHTRQICDLRILFGPISHMDHSRVRCSSAAIVNFRFAIFFIRTP